MINILVETHKTIIIKGLMMNKSSGLVALLLATSATHANTQQDLSEELTPTLYKMANEGYQFTNFYNPIWSVSSSDGEYIATTSLIPKSGIWSMRRSGENSMPFALGNQLRKFDYETNAYHNHSGTYYGRDLSHPNLGYDFKAVDFGLDIEKRWPESDLEMIEETVFEYVNEEPFHTYYVTVSGHMLYNFSDNYQAAKHKDAVAHLPYGESNKAYLATQIEFDLAMENLLEQLEAAGVADNTLIAISSDHYPYGLTNEEISELLGHTVEEYFELYKSTFILYTPNMEPTVVEKLCSSYDILPTLSNLMGIPYDSRLLIGTDIFSDKDPLVIFSNRSFLTEEYSFNFKTKDVIPFTDREITKDEVYKIRKGIDAKFAISSYVPILGGYLSDGFDLVLASVVLVKNSVGLCGVLIMISIILAPIVSIIIFQLGLRLIAGIIQPIGDSRMSEIISAISDNLTLLIVAIMGMAFMFFIMVTLVIMTCNMGV